MGPPLCRTLGVKGYRPIVGTWDCKDLLYVSAVVNVVTAALQTRPLESPRQATRRTGRSKTARLQALFVQQWHAVARYYPASQWPRVVVIIDNAPWHRGDAVTQVLAECWHVELYRLPSDSPQLNVIERVWKVLRRRATHNRLFATLTALKRSIRNSLSYFQTMRHRLYSLLAHCYPSVEEQTALTGS
jgi:transposase